MPANRERRRVQNARREPRKESWRDASSSPEALRRRNEALRRAEQRFVNAAKRFAASRRASERPRSAEFLPLQPVRRLAGSFRRQAGRIRIQLPSRAASGKIARLPGRQPEGRAD